MLNLPPPVTGSNLKDLVDSPKEKRPIIAQGFLHEKSVIMIAADPGTGKSLIALQAALQLSAGMG